jgi:hypothetical protein
VKRSLVLLLAGVLVGGFLSGCGKKFTRVRYELVREGMSPQQVEETLGTPTDTGADGWTYVHRLPYYQARIEFSDGQVSGKHWTLEKPPGPRRSRVGDDGWIEPEPESSGKAATSQPAGPAAAP